MAEDASPESIYDFTVKLGSHRSRSTSTSPVLSSIEALFPSLPGDLRVHKVGASRVASTGILRHCHYVNSSGLLDIRGNDVSLSEYKGKVVLIVNVASKCGLTQSNYKELNVLYEKYKNQGFEILAFPCNQFGGQEPGTNEQIQEATCSMFKAEFPIFDKVEVNGKNAAPLYKFLKSEKVGYFGDAIKWNFTKFLVNKEGKVVERYAPTTSPLNIEVRVVLFF
ncbi:putative glutathione peroxidase 4 [Gossypium australe]|uniref:Glutathione peroxidase n=1 Tax=Gossypium australe TaxID=47621 RepID=A0A5B6VPP0_9ROSI|nr:putative glutathione peroxidase 4 [Gossypium australe]